MDLSFVVASWNAKDYLSECLKTLTHELSGHGAEIIVVDNGSTDGSPEMVGERFPHVLLIRNDTNLGFAKANNIAIRQSTGRYIVLVNSDVKVLEGCIDRMLSYMDSHSDVGMLGPKILSADGTVQRSCMGFPTLWNSFSRALALDVVFPNSKVFGGKMMTFFHHDKISDVEVVNGCVWMVRREALNEVGLLDEKFFIYAEDIDWCKRYWVAGWKVVFYPEAEAIHFGSASSSNNPTRFYLEIYRANLKYWEKHHGRIAKFCFVLITLIHHILRLFGQLTLYSIKSSKREQAPMKIKRSVACIRLLFFSFTKKRDE
ncbi:glycosyltransferase family 2 protein [Thermodesulfobacteriota bacterium]